MPKLKPLADLTVIAGSKIVFDPSKVFAVYVIPITIFEPGHGPKQGPPKTHIWGITAAPAPIEETPQAFLQRVGIFENFVQLTGLLGPVWIKATAVSLLLSEYAGEHNPEVKCYLPTGSGSKEIWHIKEDVPTVRAKVDLLRQRSDG
jgi:hypothetical protein